MGCGCSGGSGDTTGSARRLSLTKKPGYTWDGPEEEDVVVPDEDDADPDDDPDEV